MLSFGSLFENSAVFCREFLRAIDYNEKKVRIRRRSVRALDS